MVVGVGSRFVPGAGIVVVAVVADYLGCETGMIVVVGFVRQVIGPGMIVVVGFVRQVVVAGMIVVVGFVRQ